MRLPGALIALTLSVSLGVELAGCADQAKADVSSEEQLFPKGEKNLFPPDLVDKLYTHTNTDWHVYIGKPEATPIEQPIQYPHNLHVSTLGIDCNYCHSGARKGAQAGVPSTRVCLGCHAMIDTTGRPELEKLKGYWDKGEVIPWKKVNDVPDFVYFNHKRHVTAGLNCQECHGQVQEMVTNQRVAPMTMGWCLDCHATHQSIDQNYGSKAELRRAELKDCWTCHK